MPPTRAATSTSASVPAETKRKDRKLPRRFEAFDYEEGGLNWVRIVDTSTGREHRFTLFSYGVVRDTIAELFPEEG